MPITKDELEAVVEELEQYKGRHTELITVYISAGYDVNSVQRQLQAEKSTAKNIKSTSTRKNVSEALDKIVRHLKGLKKTPENGLVLFCGNVSKTEGQQNLQLWDIEPHMPIKIRLYRCDKEFVLEPLQEMLEVSEVFGLLVMDRKEATIGLLEGKRIEVIQKMTSGIPSKVRAGGQCLSPDTIVVEKKRGEIKIEEINEGDLLKGTNLNTLKTTFNKCLKKWVVNKKEWLSIYTSNDRIFTSLDHTFFVYKNNEIVEILAKDLSKGDFLIGEKNKLNKILSIDLNVIPINLIDIEVENKNFLANEILVHNSSQRFHRITEGLTRDFYKRIAEVMKKAFFEMPKLKGILVGGPIPTKDEFLDNEYMVTRLREKVIGRIDIGGSDESGLKELIKKSQDILASQEIIHEKKLMERFFETLGEKPDLATLKEPDTKQALEYGAVETLFLSKDVDKKIAKELKPIAENINANVEIISTDTEEGQQFYNLGGIGAILRFKV